MGTKTVENDQGVNEPATGMWRAVVQFRAMPGSAYSSSSYIDPAVHPKRQKESDDAYELRVCRERCNYDAKTLECYIPAQAFKLCLESTAKYLGIKIPGKGQNRYTKHFVAGILVDGNGMLGVSRDDVEMEARFVPSNGERGGGKRVKRYFPMFRDWQVTVTFVVLDGTITREILLQHLEQAGMFRGLGRFRPENGGDNGRFTVELLEWAEI